MRRWLQGWNGAVCSRLFAPVVAMALTMVVAGCGESKPAGPKASALTAAEAAEHLQGTWQGAMKLSQEAAGKLSPKQVAGVKKMTMRMTFRPDGALTLESGVGPDAGRDETQWEFVGAEDSGETVRKITIKSRALVGEKTIEKDIDLLLDGEDAFEMPLQTAELGELGAMRFQRVR